MCNIHSYIFSCIPTPIIPNAYYAFVLCSLVCPKSFLINPTFAVTFVTSLVSREPILAH